MKKLIILSVLLLASTASAKSVRGYWRDSNHDGVKDTYVQPYQRTNPNNNPFDNYSTKGNYNPNTGKEGTVDPYQPQPFIYQPVQPVEQFDSNPWK